MHSLWAIFSQALVLKFHMKTNQRIRPDRTQSDALANENVGHSEDQGEEEEEEGRAIGGQNISTSHPNRSGMIAK